MSRLHDHVALVSNADGAIGAACCRRLAADGAHVFAGAKDRATAAAVVQAIANEGGNAQAVAHDAASESSWQQAFSDVVEQTGRFDILVNIPQGVAQTSIADTSLDDFRQTLLTAGIGPWLGQMHAVLTMRKLGRGGAIVNVTSVLAKIAAENAIAVCAAAAGLLISTKSAALECAKHKDGIAINAVVAGPLDVDSADIPGRNVLPQAPLVTADDIAEAVFFMASDGAAYMTGTELLVDFAYGAA